MVIRVNTKSSALQLLQRYSSISPIPTPGNVITNCNNCNTETPRVSVLIDLRINALTSKHIQITNPQTKRLTHLHIPTLTHSFTSVTLKNCKNPL